MRVVLLVIVVAVVLAVVLATVAGVRYLRQVRTARRRELAQYLSVDDRAWVRKQYDLTDPEGHT